MSFLSKIIPKSDYIYFDSFDRPQMKSLNIFQCFFRMAFSWYPETHSVNVVNKLYALSLNNQLQINSTLQQGLLKLVSKTQAVYKNNFFNLDACKLPDGKELSIDIRYTIKKSKNADDYKIASIDFKLFFDRNTADEIVRNVSFFKNKSEQIVVLTSPNVFQVNVNDTETLIKERFAKEDVKIINDLIAKVLHDSSSPQGTAKVHCYVGDYTFIPGYPQLGFFESCPSTESLNRVQEAEMSQLGWKYQNLFTEETRYFVTGKRVYLLNEEAAANNQNLVNSGFTQRLSFNFASSILEAQTDRVY